MKKTIAKMLVFSVTVTLPFMAGNIVYTPADEEIKVTLEEKIENEIENHTTDIPQNIECKLNAYGISDKNIASIPEGVIDNIEDNIGNVNAASAGNSFCQNVYADDMIDKRQDNYDGLLQVTILITYGKSLDNDLKTTVVLGVNTQGAGYIQAYNSTTLESKLYEMPNNPVCAIRFK